MAPLFPLPGAPQPPQRQPQQQLQPTQQPQFLNKLPFKRSYYKTLKKGALVWFNYTFWKHDNTPLVLVTDVMGDRIRGVNLHYLTLRYMKGLLQSYCGKDFFSYRFIKHDQFMVNAFRTYKKSGIRQLNILDCDVLNNSLQNVRSLNPQQVDAIRQQIQQQLQQQLNPTAEQLAQKFQQQIVPQTGQGFTPLQRDQRQDARRKFTPQSPEQMAQDLQNWQIQQGIQLPQQGNNPNVNPMF